MWLGAVIVVINVLKLPTIKGWFGELQVRLAAKLLLDKNTYHAIHNVMLRTPDGTTQIDHIFVSPYGLFVIETKNYSGWIFGDQNQPSWTQKIYRSTHKFQNPIRQNYKHVKALEALLDIPVEKIHSVIVFVGNSTFKTSMPDNVTYAGGYIRYIKSKQDVVFTPSEMSAIVTSIESGRLVSNR
jgi:hypothetical protein